jgi:molybdopterin-binding protein
VKPSARTTHVTIEVSPPVTIAASITNEASEEPQLKPGMKATAVIKASDVMGRHRLISQRHPPAASPPAAATRRAGRWRWKNATG